MLGSECILDNLIKLEHFASYLWFCHTSCTDDILRCQNPCHRTNCLLQAASIDIDLFFMYMRWILCLEWYETTINSQRYGMLYLTLEFAQILQCRRYVDIYMRCVDICDGTEPTHRFKSSDRERDRERRCLLMMERKIWLIDRWGWGCYVYVVDADGSYLFAYNTKYFSREYW